MSRNKYSNFVRPLSPSEAKTFTPPSLSGEEAKQLYLEEIEEIGDPAPVSYDRKPDNTSVRKKHRLVPNPKFEIREFTDNDLFLSAQNNDVNVMKQILDNTPDKINVLDDYGWSLLMIACQAGSIEAVKELLERDTDVSVRDRAGNSAQSLVIKSRNLVLADLLLTHKKRKSQELSHHQNKQIKDRLREKFACEVCNKTYPDKQAHLSSTIHNIAASKRKNIPVNYVIPPSNRGYQIMIKEGWNRESGLGPDGSGKKYPIKAVQKKDRKGLGHGKKKDIEKLKEIIQENKKNRVRKYRFNAQVEASFRREFY